MLSEQFFIYTKYNQNVGISQTYNTNMCRRKFKNTMSLVCSSSQIIAINFHSDLLQVNW